MIHANCHLHRFATTIHYANSRISQGNSEQHTITGFLVNQTKQSVSVINGPKNYQYPNYENYYIYNLLDHIVKYNLK